MVLCYNCKHAIIKPDGDGYECGLDGFCDSIDYDIQCEGFDERVDRDDTA